MAEAARAEPGEIRALTGLRGLCALDVVLGHYDIHNDITLHTFIFHGAAVDIFFALSSFTLCLVYGAGQGAGLPLRRYAVARFARIYPLFFATTLFAFALLLRHGLGPFGAVPVWFVVVRMLTQFLLLGALPLRAIAGSVNVQAWSVSVEAFCYVAIFPALFALAPRMRSVRWLFTLAAAGGAITLMVYRWHYTPVANGFLTPRLPTLWPYWVGLVRGAAMFVAGWATYLAWRRLPGFAQAVGLATDGIALLCLLIVLGERFDLIGKEAVVIVAPLLIAGLMDPRSLTARALAAPPVHFLGVISYSMYLLHLEVYQVLTGRLHWLLGHEAWRIAVPVAVTLGAATGSYFLFERPSRLLLRRLLEAPGARRGDVPAVAITARH